MGVNIKEKTRKQQTIKYIICLLAILMLALIAITGAWFTDSKTGEEIKVNFGNIEIELGESSTVIVLDADAQTVTRDVMPDDTLRVSMLVGKVANTEDFYWKARATVTIAGTSTILDSGWSTETYNTKENTEAVTIDFKLSGDIYGNEFENKTATIGYEVRAIQMANLTEEDAVNAIVNSTSEDFASGKNLDVVGPEIIDLSGSQGLTFEAKSAGVASLFSLDYIVDADVEGDAILTGIGDCIDTDLIIPSHCEIDGKYYRIAEIADNAFKENKNLTSLTIPNTVTRIGQYAFYCCNKITSITFEKNSQLTETANYAFFGCSKVESIEIPKSVKILGGANFAQCRSLKTVTFEEGTQLEIIGDAQFGYAPIEEIIIPKTVKSIGQSAFCRCSSLISVTFEEGSVLETIGGYAFSGAQTDYELQLTSITIPKTVKSIGYSAFSYCPLLEEFIIEEGSQLQSIGMNAFEKCYVLKSIEIPNTIEMVGKDAFLKCYNFKFNEYKNACYIGNSEQPYLAVIKPVNTSITECTIHKDARLIASHGLAHTSALTTLTFEEGSQLKYIYDYAFSNSTGGTATSGITSLTFPKSLIFIDKYAFSACKSLTSVTFAKDGELTTISDYAFADCLKIQSIEIPNTVTTIGDRAFVNCSSIASFTFEENSSVESIGQYAMGATSDSCSPNFTSIEIPNSVTTLGSYVLAYNTLLESVTFEENTGLTEFPNGMYQGCTALTSVEISSEIVKIGKYAFSACRALTEMTIPSTVKTIESSAFNNSGLVSIELSSGLTEISSSLFYKCSDLTTVIIHEGVTSIGASAFEYCYGLVRIDLPSTVKTISQKAFANSYLAVIYIASTVETITAEYDSYSPFYRAADELVIYTYASTKNEGWSKSWNYGNGKTATVVWNTSYEEYLAIVNA